MEYEQEKAMIEAALKRNAERKQRAKRAFKKFLVIKKDQEYRLRIDKFLGFKEKAWIKGHLRTVTDENRSLVGKATVLDFAELEVTDLDTNKDYILDMHPNALEAMAKLHETYTGHTFMVSYHVVQVNKFKESVWNVFDMDSVLEDISNTKNHNEA